MKPTERIEVRKIYVGRAAIFGFFYGLVIGLIAAIIVIIAGLFGFTSNVPFISAGGIILAGVIVAVMYVLISFIGSIISALVYNLISKLGGRIDIGLAEYEPRMKRF